MVTLKQACETVRKQYKLEIAGCLETKNWYKFSIAQGGELLGNASTFAVSKKDGKASWVPFFTAPKEFKEDPGIKYYDADELPK